MRHMRHQCEREPASKRACVSPSAPARDAHAKDQSKQHTNTRQIRRNFASTGHRHRVCGVREGGGWGWLFGLGHEEGRLIIDLQRQRDKSIYLANQLIEQVAKVSPPCVVFVFFFIFLSFVVCLFVCSLARVRWGEILVWRYDGYTYLICPRMLFTKYIVYM